MQTRLILSGTECKVHMGINTNAGDRWWTKTFVSQAYMKAELAVKSAFLPAPGKCWILKCWTLPASGKCWTPELPAAVNHFLAQVLTTFSRTQHTSGGTAVPCTVGKLHKHKPYLPKPADSTGPTLPDLPLPNRGLIQGSWNQHLAFLDGMIQKQLLPPKEPERAFLFSLRHATMRPKLTKSISECQNLPAP